MHNFDLTSGFCKCCGAHREMVAVDGLTCFKDEKVIALSAMRAHQRSNPGKRYREMKKLGLVSIAGKEPTLEDLSANMRRLVEMMKGPRA